MALYLISFEKGVRTIPEEEIPEVGKAGHAVLREAQEAGVYVYSGGLSYDDGDVRPGRPLITRGGGTRVPGRTT